MDIIERTIEAMEKPASGLTAERCEELWKTCSIASSIKVTPAEDKEIRDLWDTMPGHTCFMTAFFRIWNRLKAENATKLQTAELTCENGYTWKTSVSANSTKESLDKYFVGQTFSVEPYPSDATSKCVKCELIK